MKLPIEQFLYWEKHRPEKVFLRQARKGSWVNWTFEEVGQEVRLLACAIQDLDLPSKSNIALLSKNCAHWVIVDLAIMMSGHVTVPIFTTLNGEKINQILEHSQAKLLFAGKLLNWSSQNKEIRRDLKKISFPAKSHKDTQSWNSFVEGFETAEVELPDFKEDDLATIVYSSGTTGLPKGVMLSHGAIGFCGSNGQEILRLSADSRFFSYLPLSHVAERMVVETSALYVGASISFAESLEAFAKNLQETKPTLFLAVPRIWAKFQEGVFKKLPKEKLEKLLSIPLVSYLVKRKVVKQLGLDKAKVCVSGSAPISKDLLLWYNKLGIEIREGYSMTENFAYSHLNWRGSPLFGSVGQELIGVESKIGENDEVLVKSKANMLGYYRNPEATAAVLKDGYLHTEDKGRFDSKGYLYITGRIKDIFKTSKGKYVSPAQIELSLEKSQLVEQVCVIGSGMTQPVALLVLSEFAQKLDQTKLQGSLESLKKELNSSLESHEKIASFTVIKEAWSIESGMLTPTLKLKRNKIEEMYMSTQQPHAEKSGQVFVEI